MKEVDVQNQTQRKMPFQLKWILQVLVQYEIILITSPSITGVTYRDNFDFEERYRDANECNPLYWHPLHLPPKCANFFEKSIRSRLAGDTGVRIMTEKKKGYNQYSDEDTYSYSYSEETNNPPYPFYEMTSVENESQSLPLSPHEEMIEILKQNIKREPSSPIVTVMPNLGPVALYKQEISKKSEKKLMAIVKAFAKANQKMYDKYYAAHGYPKDSQESNLFVYNGSQNKTEGDIGEEIIKKNGKKGKKNKVKRVKTKNGNMVTIIETKNLDAMKDIPLF